MVRPFRRWRTGSKSATKNGKRSTLYWPSISMCVWCPKPHVGHFWWPCCGSCDRGRRGDCCPPKMASGTLSSSAFPAGAATASGRHCTWAARIYLICRASLLTLRSSAPTPAPPGQRRATPKLRRWAARGADSAPRSMPSLMPWVTH